MYVQNTVLILDNVSTVETGFSQAVKLKVWTPQLFTVLILRGAKEWGKGNKEEGEG